MQQFQNSQAASSHLEIDRTSDSGLNCSNTKSSVAHTVNSISAPPLSPHPIPASYRGFLGRVYTWNSKGSWPIGQIQPPHANLLADGLCSYNCLRPAVIRLCVVNSVYLGREAKSVKRQCKVMPPSPPEPSAEDTDGKDERWGLELRGRRGSQTAYNAASLLSLRCGELRLPNSCYLQSLVVRPHTGIQAAPASRAAGCLVLAGTP